jgi:glycosyltransferase involved in cell wall biosynthesis
VFPNSGGFDLQAVQQLAQPGPTSARRVIAIKGYQHFAGRALTALQAIGLCAPQLGGYRIRLYSATPDVKIAAELLAQETGLEVTCVPALSPNEDILRLHGSARISIGVSIADAISVSFLEAIAMGSFPIQTCTACVSEWIDDGVGGFIIPPDDPALLADRIVRAVSDDELVDRAADINRKTVLDRLERDKIRAQVIENYRQVLQESRSG